MIRAALTLTLALFLAGFIEAGAQMPTDHSLAAWNYDTFSNKYSSGESITTHASGVPGNVSFVCTKKGQFYISIWTIPKIVSDEKTKRVRRRETKKVKLFINDIKSKKAAWHYTDEFSSISPAGAFTKAALYNAAVRGDKVTLIFRKEPPITLILPRPNDAFAKFGKDCGFTPVT